MALSCGGGGDKPIARPPDRLTAETVVFPDRATATLAPNVGGEVSAGGVVVSFPAVAIAGQTAVELTTAAEPSELDRPLALGVREHFVGGLNLTLDPAPQFSFEVSIPVRIGVDKLSASLAPPETVSHFRVLRLDGSGGGEEVAIDRIVEDDLGVEPARVYFFARQGGSYALVFISAPPTTPPEPPVADNVRLEPPSRGDFRPELLVGPEVQVGERGVPRSLGLTPSQWSMNLGLIEAVAGEPLSFSFNLLGGEAPYRIEASASGSSDPFPAAFPIFQVDEGEQFVLTTTPRLPGELKLFFLIHDSADPGVGLVATFTLRVAMRPPAQAPSVSLTLTPHPEGGFEVTARVEDADWVFGETYDYQWSVSGGSLDHSERLATDELEDTVVWTDPPAGATISVVVTDSAGLSGQAELSLGGS